MNRNRIEHTPQLEHGDAGISYAMYFIAIIVTLVLFVFMQFNTGIYVAEEVLENGLHIAENKAMTVNQSTVDETGTRIDEFNKEVKRLHIVTSYDKTSSSITTSERQQLKAIGDDFSNTLQQQLGLSGSTPSLGILKELCSSNSNVILSEPVVIYEPIYERTVKRTDDGIISGTSVGKYLFESKYVITGWIKYELFFDGNNNYMAANASKSFIDVASNPTLRNGSKIEGATIEATLAVSFRGVRNIFAGVHSGSGPIFSSNPQDTIYDVEVTQSTDIVISTLDGRQT